jgi:hypothetical protein
LAAVEPKPQLAANTKAVPEVPMRRETNPHAMLNVAQVEPPSPATAESRNPLWIILAVLAVLAGSSLLKRLFTRSGPS